MSNIGPIFYFMFVNRCKKKTEKYKHVHSFWSEFKECSQGFYM